MDSRFATRGNDSNFHIELRESVTTADNARLRVDKLRFIDSFFTTDSGEYIYIKNGESFTAIGIPQQAYTGSRLASIIQSLTGKQLYIAMPQTVWLFHMMRIRKF